MNGYRGTGARLAAALVMALAVAAVWAMALLWIGYFATQFWRTDRIYENIQVMPDGTPVIQSRSATNWMDIAYRTLDGQPLQIESERWLIGASYREPAKPPGLYETPVPWQQRIAGLSDFQRPPVGWYLVRNDEPMGRAYFIGYDQFSKQRIGYIGRAGFSRAMPSRDQWFNIGRHHLGWGTGAITSAGQINWGSIAYSYGVSVEDRRMPPWVAYVIDGDRLLELDLRERSLRPLYESPGLLAAAILYEVTAQSADSAAPAAAEPTANAPAPSPLAAAAESSAPGPLQSRVALRRVERITVLDPPSGNKRDYRLPEPLREMDLTAYAVPSGELLVVWRKNNDWSRNEMELAWLRPDGTFSRQQNVTLARYDELSERVAAWLAVPVAPIAIGWLAVLGVAAPINMLQMHKAASYTDAVVQGLAFAGLPLITVILIGALLAWLTLRLQRKYRRPASGVWTTFVLLFGLPGFLAYWLEHRRPKMEACPECGRVVPRDRDACAACQALFPPPAPVGTEIFA